MTLFDHENAKMRIFSFTREIGSKTEHESSQNHEGNDSFSQSKRKYWRKWFKRTSRMRSFVKTKATKKTLFQGNQARVSLVPKGKNCILYDFNDFQFFFGKFWKHFEYQNSTIFEIITELPWFSWIFEFMTVTKFFSLLGTGEVLAWLPLKNSFF